MILPIESDGSGLQFGIKASESAEITPLPDTEEGNPVVYSPDGQWIAYAVGPQLLKRPLVGGSTVTLAEEVAAGRPGLAWLDDRTILYEQTGTVFQTGTVTRISEDGGEPLGVVIELDDVYHISGLPGGRGAIVIGRPEGNCGGNVSAYVVDLDDGSSNLVLDEVLRAWYTPTGHIVYVRTDGAVFAATFDLRSLKLADSGVLLFDGVRVTDEWADMLLGADATLLYVEGFPSGPSVTQRPLVVDLDGNEQALVLAPRDFENVSWSPDGQSVAYESERGIYTYNVALGTTPRQLTFGGLNQLPVYSPDGDEVAFSSLRDGTYGWDLFVKNLDDESPPRSIITLDANQYVTQWPSDTLIILQRSRGNVRDLWMVNLSDPDSARAEAYFSAEADLRYIAVSPDGTLAAYRSDESGQNEIYIRSFPDPGEPTVVSPGGGTPPFGHRTETPSTTGLTTAEGRVRLRLLASSEIPCRWRYRRIRCSRCSLSHPSTVPVFIRKATDGSSPRTSTPQRALPQNQTASSSSRTSSRS